MRPIGSCGGLAFEVLSNPLEPLAETSPGNGNVAEEGEDGDEDEYGVEVDGTP
jgi:hypothetical protein